ncbi:MAG: HlyD family efflux transporter periplasmic adaptor subunit, partial [Thermoguttaceae bacterium]|nr:HlyD family efflux transporter periplasmic adaptor subunit [Thermoguttaceae bacterium]
DVHVQRALDIAEAKLRAAKKEAGNDVNVRYAEAKAKVALAEIDEAEATNRKAPGTVTPFEIRRLKLAYNEAYLQMEQAHHELGIAAEKENIQVAERAAALEDIQRRKILAPWSGMIVQRYRRVGEWVKPGDPVFQIVRLDRLRIQAFLDADKIAPPEVDRQPVTVSVVLAHGAQRTFRGAVVHVNPKIENDGRFLVHAEVVNEKDASGYWLLRPGQKGEMRIELKQY